jgi:solute carrier family 25 S-adenosylmethionine transporter 26
LLLPPGNPSLTRSSFLASLAGISLAAAANISPAASASDVAKTETAANSQPLKESLSGSVAGVALTLTKTVVKYPLDTATVRLQMQDSKYSIWDLPNLLNGSYRGVEVPLLANIPSAAVFFAVKDACKESLRPYELPRWLSTSLAVGVAQFPYWLVRNPSEVVKTRLQAGLPGYGDASSPWEAFQQVGKDAVGSMGTNHSSGFTEGYYVGYWENILYACPADILKFVLYEQFSGGRKNLPPAEGALFGAAASAVAQLATTPLDVVRNRLMMKQKPQKPQTSDNDKEMEIGYLQTLVQLAQQEGLSGLFAGATPRVSKAMVSGAIQFATYEETKQAFAKFSQQNTVQ